MNFEVLRISVGELHRVYIVSLIALLAVRSGNLVTISKFPDGKYYVESRMVARHGDESKRKGGTELLTTTGDTDANGSDQWFSN